MSFLFSKLVAVLASIVAVLSFQTATISKFSSPTPTPIVVGASVSQEVVLVGVGPVNTVVPTTTSVPTVSPEQTPDIPTLIGQITELQHAIASYTPAPSPTPQIVYVPQPTIVYVPQAVSTPVPTATPEPTVVAIPLPTPTPSPDPALVFDHRQITKIEPPVIQMTFYSKAGTVMSNKSYGFYNELTHKMISGTTDADGVATINLPSNWNYSWVLLNIPILDSEPGAVTGGNVFFDKGFNQ